MKYTIKVTRPEYWQEIHDTLCQRGSPDIRIPQREVECCDEKEHSPTRGTFELESDEVELLKTHEKIEWIELCPTCNPDAYPKPEPATARFGSNVKIYRDLDIYGPPSLASGGSGSPQSYTQTVTGAVSPDYYIISGTDRNGGVSGNDPSMTFTVGDTITFNMSAIYPSHPLDIRVSLGGASASGVTGSGTASVVWDTTGLSAGTYYYQCTVHPNMYGAITLDAFDPGELNRTTWALPRTGIQTNGDFWAGVTGNPPVKFGDVTYTLTGANVDIVIHDSGVSQYHPEFIKSDGTSRVSDIVLDGPYYIDPDYFNTNGFTYTKPDGRTGITTASAEAWWENGANRSAEFASIGTVSIPATYTAARAVGDRLDGVNS